MNKPLTPEEIDVLMVTNLMRQTPKTKAGWEALGKIKATTKTAAIPRNTNSTLSIAER